MGKKDAPKKRSLKILYGAKPVAVIVTTKSGATYTFEVPDKNGFRIMHHSGLTFEVKIVPQGEQDKESSLANVGYFEVGKRFFYMPEDYEYGYWYKSGPVEKIALQSDSTDQ